MAVRKNYAKLQKKVIQNKRGNLQTVYVKHAEQKKERKNKIGVLELRSELEKLGVSVTIETDNGIHTPKGRKEAEKIYKKLDVLNYIKDHLNVMKMIQSLGFVIGKMPKLKSI